MPPTLLQLGIFQWVSRLSMTQFPHCCGVSPAKGWALSRTRAFITSWDIRNPTKRDVLMNGKG